MTKMGCTASGRSLLFVYLSACFLPLVSLGQDAGEDGTAVDSEIVEPASSVPMLTSPAAYEPQNRVLDIELSEYAGYAGLVVANGGLEPTDRSIFAKKYGFQVRLTLSEEDAWAPLNSGQIGGTVTTVDVLPLYGSSLKAVVPALISYSRGADGIVVRSGVQQINDLKGKLVAIQQFNESDYFLRYLASQAGLEVKVLSSLAASRDANKINVVACSDAFAAGDLFLRDLKSGRKRVDGCVTWEPKTTDVIEGSRGAAHALLSNKNILVIADILVLNKAFAEKYPDMIRGLVAGLLEGNRMVRENPEAHLGVIAQAFEWSESDARDELQKVLLANHPENIAFFGGTLESAGSFDYIYESALQVYGSALIPNPISSSAFLQLDALKSAEVAQLFAEQRVDIVALPGGDDDKPGARVSRNIRFRFKVNSAELDLSNQQNINDLGYMATMLRVSPGSTLLLRGHVDDLRVKMFDEKGGQALVDKMSTRAVILSEERCKSVCNALMSLHQVPQERIESIGLGWAEPLGAVSEENRRVEVQWLTLE